MFQDEDRTENADQAAWIVPTLNTVNTKTEGYREYYVPSVLLDALRNVYSVCI